MRARKISSSWCPTKIDVDSSGKEYVIWIHNDKSKGLRQKTRLKDLLDFSRKAEFAPVAYLYFVDPNQAQEMVLQLSEFPDLTVIVEPFVVKQLFKALPILAIRRQVKFLEALIQSLTSNSVNKSKKIIFIFSQDELFFLKQFALAFPRVPKFIFFSIKELTFTEIKRIKFWLDSSSKMVPLVSHRSSMQIKKWLAQFRKKL